MGNTSSSSSSSSPNQTSPADLSSSSSLPQHEERQDENTSSTTTTITKVHFPKKKLEGMALIQYKCRKSKLQYESCVSNWYKNDFMKGDYDNQEDACGDFFETYKKCVLKGIKKEYWKNNQKKPKEGSFLSELEEDK